MPPIWPKEFMAPETAPACRPPTSMQTPQAEGKHQVEHAEAQRQQENPGPGAGRKSRGQQKSGGNRQARGSHQPPAGFQAQAVREPIAQVSAQRIGQRSEHKGQHGKIEHGAFGKSAPLHEVLVEPAPQVKGRTPDVEGVHHHDQPELGAGKQLPPRNVVVRCSGGDRLGRGAIAIPPQPDHGPDHADAAEDPKRGSPGKHLHDGPHQKRRQNGSQTAGAPDQALNAGSLSAGKPAAGAAGDVGKRAGLARAEQESHEHQQAEAGDDAGHGREDGPPDDDPRQHQPMSEAVPQSAGRESPGRHKRS